MPRVASVLLATLLCSISASAEAEPSEHAMSVLKANCTKCHGATKTAGKLDVRTIEQLLIGGKRGPAIVPGNASNSRLLQLVQPGGKPHMPPGKKQLSNQDIETLRHWIDDLPEHEPTTPTEPAKPATAPHHWLPPENADPTTIIDLLVDSSLSDQEPISLPVASDATFLRRVYLDVVGRIPTWDEANTFFSSTNSLKRNQLIEQLLASKDFAKHWALTFDTILMGRNERRLNDRAKKGWHAYLQKAFEENRPWDTLAREVLLARANSKQRGHLWFLHERNNRHQDMAEAISRGFFGVDIACAQCHDHPLAAEIKQAHYWGLVAFFNRSKNTQSENGFAVAESAIGGFNDFANALAGTTDTATLLFLQRPEVPEDRPDDPDKQSDSDELYVPVDKEPRIPKFSRREKFVDEILNDHPLLARSMVNRTWALLIGRGFVHPADKMDSEHPASHPELLDWLSRDFRQHNYDVHRLIRHILCSRTYQRKLIPAQTDTPGLFASVIQKPLTAEALINSIGVALDVDVQDKAVAAEFRKLFPDVLPDNDLTKLDQAMMLSNQPELQQLFLKSAQRISAGGDSDGPASIVQQINALYEKLFLRQPTDEELFAIADYLRSRNDRHAEALSHVLWAMVCSAEFRFNH